MLNLREQREKREEIASKAILLKIWNNYFKVEDNIFYSFGKSIKTPYASGTWFRCREEEVERLREAILAGNFETKTKIPHSGRIFRLPSEWMEE